MGEISLKELLSANKNYTFLVGAGCSIDSPSCLPAGMQMMKAMLKHSCADSEVQKILNNPKILQNLRFEQLVEIIQRRLDPDLT